MSQSPPLLQRALAPLSGSLWIGFWVWTALTALVWGAGIGEAEVGLRVRQFTSTQTAVVGEKGSLQTVLELVLTWIDPVWMVLAATVVYGSVAAREGLSTARRWFGLAMAASVGLAVVLYWAGVGWGSGPIRWTARLGPKVAGLPLGWPLLWCVVVLGGRQFALLLFRRAGHETISLLVGLLATMEAYGLEPLAQKWRVFWFWGGRGVAPAGLGLIWGVTAWLFCRTWLRGKGSGFGQRRDLDNWRAAWVFVALIGLCLAGHFGRAMTGRGESLFAP